MPSHNWSTDFYRIHRSEGLNACALPVTAVGMCRAGCRPGGTNTLGWRTRELVACVRLAAFFRIDAHVAEGKTRGSYR